MRHSSIILPPFSMALDQEIQHRLTTAPNGPETGHSPIGEGEQSYNCQGYRLQVVHYDKTRPSEGSRVRSQMAASADYADSFLVLTSTKQEPWEPHWPVDVMVSRHIASRSTLGRLFQEIRIGFRLAAGARKNKYDLLHSHHNTGLVVALIWLLFCSKPVIFDSHDLFGPNIFKRNSWFRRFCSWFKWNVLQGWVLNKSLCGIHVSPGIVEIYKKRFPLARHEMLWNLPAFALSKELKEPAAVSLSFTRKPWDSIKLIYFGLITSTRISLELIKAVSQIPGIELNLYGRIYDQADDFDQYSSDFRKLLGEIGVKWHGPYKTSELPAILSQCDLLLFPSPVSMENNKHALPNKLFESCWNGIGLVCSDVFQDLNLIAAKYGFGCSFDPLSMMSLRTTLERLVMDPEEVGRMKSNAAEFLKSGEWSANSYKTRLFEIYQSALPARQNKRVEQ